MTVEKNNDPAAQPDSSPDEAVELTAESSLEASPEESAIAEPEAPAVEAPVVTEPAAAAEEPPAEETAAESEDAAEQASAEAAAVEASLPEEPAAAAPEVANEAVTEQPSESDTPEADTPAADTPAEEPVAAAPEASAEEGTAAAPEAPAEQAAAEEAPAETPAAAVSKAPAEQAAPPESAARELAEPEAPDESAEPEAPKESPFASLGLKPVLLKALDDVGYETPSPIQALTIPPILAGRDVVGQAQTGTGKTAAFALPLLSRLDPEPRTPQVMVLTPTRELAIQVAEAFQRYASHMRGFRVLPIYGGQGYDGQLRQLRRGVHVVVGTPGRVMDHMRRGTLDLSLLQCLVLDEADEMLRMGFIEDVEWILQQTPESRQVALFSATMPPVIRRIASQHLTDPKEITIKVKTTTADTIRQRYWSVSGVHKLDALTRILEAETYDAMIIFVRTKTATVELAEKLGARGVSAAAINGDMAQQARERTVERLRSGKLDVLVATDVAARGLDVERISHVVNFDVPYDTDSYVHRVGRTGRAGRTGEAILFISPRERRMLHHIEQATRQRIERMELPSTEVINDRRVIRFKQKITDTLATDEWKPFLSILEQYQAEHDMPALEIAAALAKLLQGDEPLLLQPPPRRPERHERRDRHPSYGAGGRGGRGPGGPGSPSPLEAGLERYRLEVGRAHGVQPGNIVGAIANEANLDSSRMGRIFIYDDFSTIDLPVGMPREIFRLLKRIRVCGQVLRIARLDQAGRPDGSPSFPPGPERRPKGPGPKPGRAVQHRGDVTFGDGPRRRRPSARPDDGKGGPRGEKKPGKSFSPPDAREIARQAQAGELPRKVTHEDSGSSGGFQGDGGSAGKKPKRKKERWSGAKRRAVKRAKKTK